MLKKLKNMNFKKLLTKMSIFLFILAIFPFSASALGLVTEPILVENALRGNEYQETLIMVNTEDKITRLEFTSDGQTKEWVSFFKTNDTETAISEIEIPAKAKMEVLAIFSVPEDTPNGEYKGSIGVVTIPATGDEQDESYSTVNQRIDNEVTIIITDNEIINLNISVIPKSYDINPGDPLEIRFIYDNQGNISLSPQMDLKISHDGKTIHNVIYPYPEGEGAVKPSAQHEIPTITIPTAGFSEGKYRAEMKFLHNGESILEKDFSFTIGDNVKVLGWMGKLKDYGWVKILYKALYVLVILFVLVVVVSLYKSKKLKKTD